MLAPEVGLAISTINVRFKFTQICILFSGLNPKLRNLGKSPNTEHGSDSLLGDPAGHAPHPGLLHAVQRYLLRSASLLLQIIFIASAF